MTELTAVAVEADPAAQESEQPPMISVSPTRATTRRGFSMTWDEKPLENVRWIIQPRPDGAWFDLQMPEPMPHRWYRFWQRVLFGWKWEEVR